MTKTRTITYTALFAAIAAVLMYFEFPLPFMPPFLKVDLSGAATMIAGFTMGPVSAVIVTLIKDLVHVLSSQTGGVGELADFLCTSAFAVTASVIYRRYHTRKGALVSCGAAIAVMTVCGMLANRFLLIPFYSKIMPIDAILSACAQINPLIGSLDTYILFGAGPFNLLKGVILSLITVLLYKRLSSWMKTVHFPQRHRG